MTEINVTQTENSIKLIRGASYTGWEIKCHNDDLNKAMAEIEIIDKELRKRFPKEQK